MRSILNKKVEFKTVIEAIKKLLGILLPWVDAFKDSKNETGQIGTLYDVRLGNPIVIRCEKIMSRHEQMYGKIESGFALDMIKTAMKREICDEIMKSNLFEWELQETEMGTKICARIIVNKF